ncbi:hypothetical protein ON010_g16757 [Phytophthora cinnamomi]|nr:hypothetical protein ON010_g16757 [Phytophthora cinnamomi]
MFFGHVLIPLKLAYVVADEGSSSDTGSKSGSGSLTNAGDFGAVAFVPAEANQAQLLSTADIAPGTIVAVSSSYSALNGGATGLGATTTPDTTVAASGLSVPSLANETTGTIESIGNSTTTPTQGLSARTQFTYNCTSARYGTSRRAPMSREAHPCFYYLQYFYFKFPLIFTTEYDLVLLAYQLLSVSPTWKAGR